MGKRKASLYALVLGCQNQEIAVSIINLEYQISIRTQNKSTKRPEEGVDHRGFCEVVLMLDNVLAWYL